MMMVLTFKVQIIIVKHILVLYLDRNRFIEEVQGY